MCYGDLMRREQMESKALQTLAALPSFALGGGVAGVLRGLSLSGSERQSQASVIGDPSVGFRQSGYGSAASFARSNAAVMPSCDAFCAHHERVCSTRAAADRPSGGGTLRHCTLSRSLQARWT
jgi:hypothetical protein